MRVRHSPRLEWEDSRAQGIIEMVDTEAEYVTDRTAHETAGVSNKRGCAGEFLGGG